MRQRPAQLVLTAVALGLLTQYLLLGQRAGLGIPVAVAASLAVAWSARPRGARVGLGQTAVPAAALVYASLCAIRTDAPLVAFDALAAIGLTLASFPVLRGVPLLSLPLRPLIGEAAGVVLASATRAPRVLRDAAPVLGALLPARTAPVAGYAAGVVLALPLLVVFGALFASADPLFDRAIRGLLDLGWLARLVPELPARVALGTAVAWIALGAITTERRAAVAPVRRLLTPRAAIGALVTIDLLFASFVALQVAYLFGGREALDAAGISYSAYARRGFFELVAVATVVAGTLFVLDLALRRRGRAYVAAALGLVGLTGVVLASALLRLVLYQQAYGWSELRLYALAAIGFLALTLAVLAVAVVMDGMSRAVQPVAGAALAVALGLNIAGPSGVVAGANMDRFIDPSGLPDDAFRGLDVAYLAGLGDGAVPAVVARLPLLPPTARGLTRDMLIRLGEHREGSGDWRSWNADRARADELLRRQ